MFLDSTSPGNGTKFSFYIPIKQLLRPHDSSIFENFQEEERFNDSLSDNELANLTERIEDHSLVILGGTPRDVPLVNQEILVVDDTVFNIEIVEMLFKTVFGLPICKAFSGQECIAAIA